MEPFGYVFYYDVSNLKAEPAACIPEGLTKA